MKHKKLVIVGTLAIIFAIVVPPTLLVVASRLPHGPRLSQSDYLLMAIGVPVLIGATISSVRDKFATRRSSKSYSG